MEYQSGGKDLTSNFKHPSASFMCHVARRPGYFLWNIILFFLFLTGLSFAAWAIEPESVHFRLPVVLILLLTTVTFKMTLTKFLPTTPYVSLVDVYGIASFIFLGLQVIAVCVISVYAKDK